MNTPQNTDRDSVESTALFGAVGPCPDPVQRVHRLYMVNTSASNVRGQLRILVDMSRDSGVPAWYCDRLEKLAAALVTVADLESPNVQKAVRESARRLELDGVTTPHNFRHAYATHLLDRGVNIKSLAQAMGHASIETTSGYVHAEALSVPSPL